MSKIFHDRHKNPSGHPPTYLMYGPLVNCDLKTVSHRLAILLCLTTGQRDQTIKILFLECLKVFDDRAILFILDKL